jgi:hypothetical protein
MKNPITRQAPTRFDCDFHGTRSAWGLNSITKAIKQGRLTQDDADLILSYTTERQANRQISVGRRNKIIYYLVDWRRYISEFRKNTLADLHKGIIGLQDAKLKGKPYKRNTLHDKIEFLLQAPHTIEPRQKKNHDTVTQNLILVGPPLPHCGNLSEIFAWRSQHHASLATRLGTDAILPWLCLPLWNHGSRRKTMEVLISKTDACMVWILYAFFWTTPRFSSFALIIVHDH